MNFSIESHTCGTQMPTFFTTVPTHTSKCRLVYLQGLPESFNSCECMIFTADILKTSEFIETTVLLWFLEEMQQNHIPLTEKWLLVRQIWSQNNKTSTAENKTKQKTKTLQQSLLRVVLDTGFTLLGRKEIKIILHNTASYNFLISKWVAKETRAWHCCPSALCSTGLC